MNKTHPFGEGDGTGDHIGSGYVHLIYDMLAIYPERNRCINKPEGFKNNIPEKRGLSQGR